MHRRRAHFLTSFLASSSNIGPCGIAASLPSRLPNSLVSFLHDTLLLHTKRDTVLDEAHKYLTDTGTASRLTDTLLTIIRQQRHENMRVLISTQEPTVVPSQSLDLCSFILAHRFSSPRWLKHLAEHVSAAGSISEDWASKVRVHAMSTARSTC
jgi:hypothetical protein